MSNQAKQVIDDQSNVEACRALRALGHCQGEHGHGYVIARSTALVDACSKMRTPILKCKKKSGDMFVTSSRCMVAADAVVETRTSSGSG